MSYPFRLQELLREDIVPEPPADPEVEFIGEEEVQTLARLTGTLVLESLEELCNVLLPGQRVHRIERCCDA